MYLFWGWVLLAWKAGFAVPMGILLVRLLGWWGREVRSQGRAALLPPTITLHWRLGNYRDRWAEK